MGDFRGNNRFGGNNRSFGDRDQRAPREMFSAVCSNCGKACQVPFRPTGSKPVLCSECFEKEAPERSRDFRGNTGGGRSFDRPQRFGDRTNDRPFQPRESFHSQPSQPSHSELDMINAKLDSILKLLTVKNTNSNSVIAPRSAEVKNEESTPVAEKPKRAKKVIVEAPAE